MINFNSIQTIFTNFYNQWLLGGPTRIKKKLLLSKALSNMLLWNTVRKKNRIQRNNMKKQLLLEAGT
uniref:Uncharacterized protein n=1 Tax=Strongyloides stercoralis TaxID=6248 RepID=A0A0K0ESZ4_STRER